MKRGMYRLRGVLPSAVLTALLLLAVGCSNDLPASAPANAPVAKTSSTPTGDVQTPGTPSDVQTPGTPSDVQTPGTPSDVETPGTPTDDVQTPEPDQEVSSDPFCKKLELDKAAFEKIGDSSSEEDDTPEQIQAASQAIEQIASEAPGEIKPALEQVAKLLPKVDTDNPDMTAAAQFATAMQTLVGWSVQHCGRDLFS